MERPFKHPLDRFVRQSLLQISKGNKTVIKTGLRAGNKASNRSDERTTIDGIITVDIVNI